MRKCYRRNSTAACRVHARLPGQSALSAAAVHCGVTASHQEEADAAWCDLAATQAAATRALCSSSSALCRLPLPASSSSSKIRYLRSATVLSPGGRLRCPAFLFGTAPGSRRHPSSRRRIYKQHGALHPTPRLGCVKPPKETNKKIVGATQCAERERTKAECCLAAPLGDHVRKLSRADPSANVSANRCGLRSKMAAAGVANTRDVVSSWPQTRCVSNFCRYISCRMCFTCAVRVSSAVRVLLRECGYPAVLDKRSDMSSITQLSSHGTCT